MHNSTTYTTTAAVGRIPRVAAAVATAIGLVAVVGASASAQIDEEPADGECGRQIVGGLASIDLAPQLGPHVDPGPELAALLRGEVLDGIDCSTGAEHPSGQPDLTDVPVWPNWPV